MRSISTARLATTPMPTPSRADTSLWLLGTSEHAPLGAALTASGSQGPDAGGFEASPPTTMATAPERAPMATRCGCFVDRRHGERRVQAGAGRPRYIERFEFADGTTLFGDPATTRPTATSSLWVGTAGNDNDQRRQRQRLRSMAERATTTLNAGRRRGRATGRSLRPQAGDDTMWIGKDNPNVFIDATTENGYDGDGRQGGVRRPDAGRS